MTHTHKYYTNTLLLMVSWSPLHLCIIMFCSQGRDEKSSHLHQAGSLWRVTAQWLIQFGSKAKKKRAQTKWCQQCSSMGNCHYQTSYLMISCNYFKLSLWHLCKFIVVLFRWKKIRPESPTISCLSMSDSSMPEPIRFKQGPCSDKTRSWMCYEKQLWQL